VLDTTRFFLPAGGGYSVQASKPGVVGGGTPAINRSSPQDKYVRVALALQWMMVHDSIKSVEW